MIVEQLLSAFGKALLYESLIIVRVLVSSEIVRPYYNSCTCHLWDLQVLFQLLVLAMSETVAPQVLHIDSDVSVLSHSHINTANMFFVVHGEGKLAFSSKGNISLERSISLERNTVSEGNMEDMAELFFRHVSLSGYNSVNLTLHESSSVGTLYYAQLDT